MTNHRRIHIGWTAVEMVYLQAALTLPRAEHTKAFQDIAALTHRSIHAVRTKAYALQQAIIDDRAAGAAAARRQALVHMQAQSSARTASLPPSALKQPTPEQLRAGRAKP